MAEELQPLQPIEEVEPEQPEVVEPTTEVEPEAPEIDKEPEGEAVTPEDVTEPAAEEPKEPSRREQLRIQQLLSKLKEQPIPERKVEGGLDYNKLDADEETKTLLENDRKAVAEDQYRKGLDQAKSIQFHTRLDIDAPKVESKYPQLNKESDQFNPALADAINSTYLHLVGYDSSTDTVQNPGLRYADFVESQAELAKSWAEEQVEKTTRNVAKQAATTGLRPDGSSAKRLNLNKAPEDMTEEELNAAIGQTLPRR